MSVVRFGVSLEQDLLDELDAFVKDNVLSNRSQGIRRLIKNYLFEKKWQCNNVVAGSITLVYNPHKNDLSAKLGNIQLEYRDVILSSQHFYLSTDESFEIIAVRGESKKLTELADKIRALKGINRGKLAMTSAG
ncbi:nickel-responsive transcriptional regulator NikR [Marinilabilia salmonicolor]|jgi:CopG family nickel-responsive transcriptional regulator|uniref:Putative nickel-responsive regulator n=1 Tax=Marinilabilia salmonicolor TaxID=989 RepID=A0A2T0X4P0_9BACT|nr:nickel-responsive transcriptional regulator NikR [Marinilabilia salmonicolor]PRY93834.1 CopG family nickel-responsive transcriptional regulator [Marinilabilia salmonicolor]RCW30204.1 CopG family nickel-responsive transcriptional regulator [Marinilabilia salmonicolor]